MQVEVSNSDGTPAQGVKVVVDPGQVLGITSDKGMARLPINTEENMHFITVTVRDHFQITSDSHSEEDRN